MGLRAMQSDRDAAFRPQPSAETEVVGVQVRRGDRPHVVQRAPGIPQPGVELRPVVVGVPSGVDEMHAVVGEEEVAVGGLDDPGVRQRELDDDDAVGDPIGHAGPPITRVRCG
jgi:hypothetical protein